LEKPLKEDEILRHSILSKINELLDCVQTLGNANFFEITVRHINGELITETNFSETSYISKLSAKTG